jgi:hypothetical protein
LLACCVAATKARFEGGLPIDDARLKRVEAAARQRPEPSCSITWSRFGPCQGQANPNCAATARAFGTDCASTMTPSQCRNLTGSGAWCDRCQLTGLPLPTGGHCTRLRSDPHRGPTVSRAYRPRLRFVVSSAKGVMVALGGLRTCDRSRGLRGFDPKQACRAAPNVRKCPPQRYQSLFRSSAGNIIRPPLPKCFSTSA